METGSLARTACHSPGLRSHCSKVGHSPPPSGTWAACASQCAKEETPWGPGTRPPQVVPVGKLGHGPGGTGGARCWCQAPCGDLAPLSKAARRKPRSVSARQGERASSSRTLGSAAGRSMENADVAPTPSCGVLSVPGGGGRSLRRLRAASEPGAKAKGCTSDVRAAPPQTGPGAARPPRSSRQPDPQLQAAWRPPPMCRGSWGTHGRKPAVGLECAMRGGPRPWQHLRAPLAGGGAEEAAHLTWRHRSCRTSRPCSAGRASCCGPYGRLHREGRETPLRKVTAPTPGPRGAGRPLVHPTDEA